MRVYWDDQERPSIDVTLTDFFALPWGATHDKDGQKASVQVNSLPVVVAPRSGLTVFCEMPFRGRCRITLQNIHPTNAFICFYQINYVLTDVPVAWSDDL